MMFSSLMLVLLLLKAHIKQFILAYIANVYVYNYLIKFSQNTSGSSYGLGISVKIY